MSGSVAICTICLQEMWPIFGDLQSISACGHVFHERCLQGWMESSSQRDLTCPLCKAWISSRVHGVQRLNFQSAGSNSTQPQVSPSRNLQTVVEDSEHVNYTSGICKLETKLSSVRNCIIEQLKEFESQVAVNLQRAEEAEAATRIASSKLARCRQHLTDVREVLEREEELVQKVRAVVQDLTS